METINLVLSGILLFSILAVGITLIVSADTVGNAVRRTVGILLVAAVLTPLLGLLAYFFTSTEGKVALGIVVALTLATAWARFRDRRATSGGRRQPASVKRRVGR